VRALLAALGSSIALGLEAQDWQAAIRAQDYARARAALESALAASPDDAALRYELARVLGYSSSAAAALAQFDTLLARYPDNADYLLGRAQMLARLGRNEAALESTAKALELAPDYADVWELHLRLTERTADRATAEALRQQVAARFPDSDWWRRPPARAEYTRWLSLDWGTERLSNGAPDWRRRSLRLEWQTPGGASFHGAVADGRRFERSDSTIELGGSFQALTRWRIGGGLAATSDSNFEPARTLSASAQRPWRDGWGTELALKKREYPGADVVTYTFTGDRYFADYRIAYRLDYSRLLGAGSSTGHALILGWYPNERRTLGATLGAGAEIETVGIDQLLRTRVASVTLHGRETLSPRFTLGWWLGTHDQGDFYRRRYGGLALRIGF
jgi:YaiO family outer membrane protein